MDIDQLRHDDIEPFLALANAEGWISERWELEFLCGNFPRGCLAAREAGETVGYVTSIKYGVSGWIGNLIVRSAWRGKGIGAALMEGALAALTEAGADTVWLTASEQGKSLYDRLGFVTVDVINRWVGKGLWTCPPALTPFARREVLEIDSAGWGDRRDALIDAAAQRGTIYSVDGAFLIIQPCGTGIQIGPWGGAGSEALLLLDKALMGAGKGTPVLLDVPIRNTGQTAFLMGKGFSISGSTLLMVRGGPPAYSPGQIGALASMGSMG